MKIAYWVSLKVLDSAKTIPILSQDKVITLRYKKTFSLTRITSENFYKTLNFSLDQKGGSWIVNTNFNMKCDECNEH